MRARGDSHITLLTAYTLTWHPFCPTCRFYFPHRQKMVCGNPRAKWVRDGMKLLNTRKKALLKHHQDTGRNFQGR